MSRFWRSLRPAHATLALALGFAHSLSAQCPDGTPPPCGPRRPAAPPLVPQLRQLTTSGKVQYATVSPDGRFLAYVEDSVLWLRNLTEGGRSIEVSRETSRFRLALGNAPSLRAIHWLSDGARLVTRGDSGTFILSALGGPVRLVAETPMSAVSPDGRQVATYRSAARMIRIQNLETGATITRTVPGAYRFFLEATWSPDARWLLALTTDGAHRFELRSVSPASDQARLLLSDSLWLGSPRWDARASCIYYLRGTGPAMQLWRLPVSAATGARTGAPVLVMPVFEGDQFALARDGRDLVFRRATGTASTLESGVEPDTSRRRLASGSAQILAGLYSPDGRTIALVQGDETGGASIFLAPTDSGDLEQLTHAPERTVTFMGWSPDGDRIAYCTIGQGRPRIDVLPRRGGVPMRLDADDVGLGCQFAWLSADTLMYEPPGNRNFAIRTLAAPGRDRLVPNDSVGWMNQPVVNPKTADVAVFWNRGDEGGVWLIDRRTGNQRRVLPGLRPLMLRFSRDGSSLYVVNDGALLRIGLGETTRVDTLPTLRGCDVFEIRPDGRRVLCIITESTTADAWLIRDFDPAAPRTP